MEKIRPKNEKFRNFFWYYWQSHFCPYTHQKKFQNFSFFSQIFELSRRSIGGFFQNSQFSTVPCMVELNLDSFRLRKIFEVRPPLRATVGRRLPLYAIYSITQRLCFLSFLRFLLHHQNYFHFRSCLYGLMIKILSWKSWIQILLWGTEKYRVHDPT